MNNVVLIGNLARDPEQRTTGGGTSVTTFTIAVSRRFKSQDGTQATDFISCVAWRNTADFVAKYFQKGSKIAVNGSMQTRNYDDAQGIKRYVTEVVVDHVEFVTSKAQSQQGNRDGGRDDFAGLTPPSNNQQAAQPNADDLFADELGDFEPLDDAELPF